MSTDVFFKSKVQPNIQKLVGTLDDISGGNSIDLKKGNINLDKGNISLKEGQLLAYSDETLKTDIRPIENALERVDKLKGVYYYWKDDTKNEKTQQIGVIAQNVQQEFPELVNTDKNGVLCVDYPKLTAILIECVKELKQQLSQRA
jgi:archaellin